MFRAIKAAFLRENSVKGASIILVITLALSNVLGVIRDHFLASRIPTDRLDVYFAAFRLPDLIFNVLILGSIAAAFVPVYSKYRKEQGQEAANRVAQSTITVIATIEIIALIVLFFLMPVLIRYLVVDFSPDKKLETVYLARWLLLSPVFFAFSYFLGGILNSHKRFVAYSIAPLIYNLSIIVAVLIFADRIGVKGVVIGVLAGAFLHMLIQLPSAIEAGFRPKILFDLKNAGMRRIVKLMVPRSIGLGANQILLVSFTVFASAFPGALAIYNFADNIQTVPSVIFGTSFATAVFPTLAGLSLERAEERSEFNRFFSRSLRIILFLLIPSSAFLLVLRAQVIRLILGYGFFGWGDTKAAAAALGFFALSVVAQGLIPLLARTFYAVHNTLIPMLTSIASIVVSIVFGYLFSRGIIGGAEGVAGLALAFSIGSWLNLLLLAVMILQKVEILWRDLIIFLLQVVFLSVLSVLAIQVVKELMAGVVDIDRVRFLALQTGLALLAGAVAYLGGAYLMRIREIRS